ncbi:hypothetical protein AHAS_Ahas12G0103800 [Arachis hypogaea]
MTQRGRRRETAAVAAPLPPRPTSCAATIQLVPPPRHSSPSRGRPKLRERAARGEGGVAVPWSLSRHRRRQGLHHRCRSGQRRIGKRE